MTLAERIWSKAKADGSGCWLWFGAKSTDGYGRIKITVAPRQYVRRNAHRVAYELVNGPVEDGLVVDHLCRVRHCINPAHLEAVTQRVNIQRAVREHPSHCPQGHLYDEANTAIWQTQGRGPERRCKACNRIRAHRDYRAAEAVKA